MNEDFNTVSFHSLLSVISQMLSAAVGFFSIVYFAKVLGAGVLGNYFLFISYFSLISTFIDLGFGKATIKRISEKSEMNEYYSAYIVIRIILVTLLVLTLLIFKDYFFTVNVGGTFTWLIIALIVSILSETSLYSIAGAGKVGVLAVTMSVDNISRIVVQVLGVYLGYSLFGMIGGFVAGLLIGGLVRLKFLGLKIVRFNKEHLRKLMGFSFWSFIVAGSIATFHSVDTILIGHYMQSSDVGIYRVGLQLSGVLYIFSSSICSALYPKVSRWGVIGEKELIEKSLSRGITYSLFLIIPFVAGGILLGDVILLYLYSPEFASGYTTFVILLISQIANIFHSFYLTYLSALDKLKESFIFMLISVVTNIGLNLILIPIMGISGAGIATVLNLSSNAFMAKQLLSQNMNIRLENTVGYIFKATVIMSLFIAVYRMIVPITGIWLMVVPIILGGVIYFVLLFKFDSKIYNEIKGIILYGDNR